MSSLPAPLVPLECNMAGNDWFPFYFQRVRKSKWWRRASDLARARNIMLWGEAYQSTPAGSMPDDDDDLAEAAGFGMDIDAFLAVKDEIMSPWTMCSDGRWYHPTLCEVVMEAWEKIGERRRKEAEKKAAQRARVRQTAPKPANVPAKIDAVPRDIATVPGDMPLELPLSPHVPAQTEQTGQDSMEAIASLSPEVDDKPEYPDLFEFAWKAYPHVKGRSSKPKAVGIWRRLSRRHRDQLPAACARYAREGREPKAECGAPGMHLWLRDQKFMDWLDGEAPSAPADPLETTRRRVDRFKTGSGFWNTTDWGPQPGRPGCTVPPAVLAEFGFTLETADRSAA